MFEVGLVSVFALFTAYLVVDTKIKLRKRNKVCNIVLNNAKLKSCESSIDDVVKLLKDSNAAISYDCMKEV